MRQTAAQRIKGKTDADSETDLYPFFCADPAEVSSPRGACGGMGDMIEWRYICRKQEEDR